MTYAIEINKLTKQYPKATGWKQRFRKSFEQPAVDKVSLAINRGELVGLVGPNGAGKTTLIKMLTTLILPTSGSAWVNTFPLTQDFHIRQSVGLVTSDERSFFWRLTGIQNLEFFAALNNISRSEIPTRVQELIILLQLSGFADKQFQFYSTGMKQRLSIARALLSKPSVLLLDEPTKGLDPEATKQINDLIRNQLCRDQGVTVLLSSHRLDEVEKFCDRIAIMFNGKVEAFGTMQDLTRIISNQRKSHIEPTNISGIDPTILSLDEIFSYVVQTTSLMEKSENEETNPKIHRTTTDYHPKSNATKLIDFLRVSWAFLIRDIRSELSYKVSFFLQFFNVFFWAFGFFFISRMISGASIPYLDKYGGDYFSFVLIGLALVGYFDAGLSGFSSSLRQAQTTGTLEAMISTPTNLSSIIICSSQWSYLVTTLRVLVFLVVGTILLGADLQNGNYLAALLILILTVISFSSIGIIAASFIMVLKRGNPITWIVGGISFLLGGVYYPISVMPEWMQTLAYFLPVTHSLEGMRLALINNAPISSLLDNIIVLVIFSIVLPPLSLLAFRISVKIAKMDGSLTHY